MKLFFSKIKFLYYCILGYGFVVGLAYFKLMCLIEREPEFYYVHIDQCKVALNKFILTNDKDAEQRMEQYIAGMETNIKPVVEKMIKHRAQNT